MNFFPFCFWKFSEYLKALLGRLFLTVASIGV
jgi:hypothetical protein